MYSPRVERWTGGKVVGWLGPLGERRSAGPPRHGKLRAKSRQKKGGGLFSDDVRSFVGV
jgi:hypothetical protein